MENPENIQQALRESERRLSTLMGHLPGMAYRCRNDKDWTMEFVSLGCLALTGYAPADLIGNKTAAYGKLIRPEDRRWVWEYVQRHLVRRMPFQIEYRIHARDGTEKWVWEQGSGVLDDHGDLVALEGFITDVTDRKRAEEARRQMEIQVLHTQKLESLGVLAGGIAHDFNNILAGIMGYADLAMVCLPASEPARAHVAEIEKASRRAADLTRQMLAYSGKGRFVVEPFDLSKVVEDGKKMLEISVSKKATLRYDLACGLPAVRGDASEIAQVLMNLVINASEALDDQGGTITIATGAAACDPQHLDDVVLGKNLGEAIYVRLEVADTGCGMDERTIERIFDPFFTTKFTGRGLGLAAVQGIVRGHQGVIQVSSVQGRGTRFRVLFPATDATPSQPASVAAAPSHAPNTGTVLVVDDDETIRRATGAMFEVAGFSVLTASDGEEAIAAYRDHRDRIVCVYLDLTMPKMDGQETLRELRRIDAGVRVVVASGYSEEEVAGRFAGQGVLGFIQKPQPLDTIIAKLREVLENGA
jgi:PAS domain S-box-containing protein